MSVDAKPMRITSIPCDVAPSENASAKFVDDGRISSPIIIVDGSRSSCRNLA